MKKLSKPQLKAIREIVSVGKIEFQYNTCRCQVGNSIKGVRPATCWALHGMGLLFQTGKGMNVTLRPTNAGKRAAE